MRLCDRPGNSLCATSEIFFSGLGRVAQLLFFFLDYYFGAISFFLSRRSKTKKQNDTMVVSKRKQDKIGGYPVASKKPKFGKELEKPKSAAGKKDVEFKKSKKPAKPLPKRTVLSVESDSDELDDDGDLEIKDDGSEGEEEEDGMDIDQPSKENADGQSGCE